MDGRSIIDAKEIRRSFRSTKKEEGWKGALGLLFRPTVQTHEALKGVSFSLQSGEFIGLIGENGAGKTTLLKILSGLIPPTSGTAHVLGYVPFDRTLDFRRRISLVMGQKAQLWWDLPANDAFDLLRAIYEIPPRMFRDRLGYLTNLLDVGRLLSTQIRRLSLGERMKMELIGALLHWPQIVFLDEPTIGLDVLAAHKLREFLKTFNQQEKSTIILTSHNMEDIERLCNRVLILRSGTLIYDGAPGHLTRQEERQLRVRILQEVTPEQLRHVIQYPVENISVDSTEELKTFRITLKREQIVSVLQNLMKNYDLVDMGIEEQSLETVIHHLYQETVHQAS